MEEKEEKWKKMNKNEINGIIRRKGNKWKKKEQMEINGKKKKMEINLRNGRKRK